MSAAKVKARKMWAPHDKPSIIYEAKSSMDKVCYYILPADADSIERMVEQINHGIMSLSDGRDHYTSRDIARAALAAIGVKAKGNK